MPNSVRAGSRYKQDPKMMQYKLMMQYTLRARGYPGPWLIYTLYRIIYI